MGHGTPYPVTGGYCEASVVRVLAAESRKQLGLTLFSKGVAISNQESTRRLIRRAVNSRLLDNHMMTTVRSQRACAKTLQIRLSYDHYSRINVLRV